MDARAQRRKDRAGSPIWLWFILLVAAASAVAFTFTACRGPAKNETQNKDEMAVDDPFLWLEEAKSSKALAWVKEKNQTTLAVLRADPRFGAIEGEVREIVMDKDRLPNLTIRGAYLYNFWQDESHIRGIWRRADAESFAKGSARWETLLDLDALAKAENENWVYEGVNCLPPRYQRCMISLSRGGRDSMVRREFDLGKKAFVPDGFILPEAKSHVSWRDENTLFVATDFGPGTMSKAGYPIVVKSWRRGTDLISAPEVLRAEADDSRAVAFVNHTVDGSFVFFAKTHSRYNNELWYLTKTGQSVPIPIPKSARMLGVFDRRILYLLRESENLNGVEHRAGSLLALPIDALSLSHPLTKAELIFAPTESVILTYADITKSALLLNTLDNVRGRILQARRQPKTKKWQLKRVNLPGEGSVTVDSTDVFGDSYLLSYQDFLTPKTLFTAESSRTANKPKILRQAPRRFDPSPYIAEQWFAKSKDGTRVPYFIVRRKNSALDGTHPTLIYGYGGFEDTQEPFYLGSIGKVWLDRGGVYALANIRGGGEFGPAWHTSALRENRQRSFDDFIAVAEDLIHRKVTRPRRLAIEGASNGGLLVGAVFTQRPELFNGVICKVPLLDMIRYPKIGAGRLWTEEYGDPAQPAMREILLKYSPYHNVRADKKYPEIFLMTSTEDDRVQPAHARKMAAVMEKQRHPLLYFENIEGGHGAAANLEQVILKSTLEYTYLVRQVMDASGARDARSNYAFCR